MRFGERLKLIREEVGLTQTDLAKRSGLDVTTLNRLERGKGSLPRATTIRRLVDGLGWTQDDERVQELLRAAERHPIEMPAAAHPTRSPAAKLLKEIDKRGLGLVTQIGNEDEVTRTGGSQKHQRVSKKFTEPELLDSPEKALERAADLVAATLLLDPKNTHTAEILMTFQGEQDLTRFFPDRRSRWQQELRDALKRGWDVIHLMRLNESRSRLFDLVEGMLGLLGDRGSYSPRYFKDNSTLNSPYDLLIVPDQGALLFLSARQEFYVDTAFFYPPGEYLNTLLAHFALMRSQTVPLVKTYLPDTQAFDEEFERAYELYGYYPRISMAFDAALAHAYQYEGDRYLFMGGLGQHTVPFAMYDEYTRPMIGKSGAKAAVLHSMLENRQRVIATFRDQVKKWHFFDICPMSAIIQMIDKGIPTRDDWLLYLGPEKLTSQQVVTHLRNLIRLLEDYPNFELGLLDDLNDDGQNPAIDQISRIFWAVKGRHSVFLEAWLPDSSGRKVEVDLEITEPTIVETFKDYFLGLWQDIPHEKLIKDKNAVIRWLMEQIHRAELARTATNDS